MEEKGEVEVRGMGERGEDRVARLLLKILFPCISLK